MKCLICNQEFKFLPTHLMWKHHITSAIYKGQYGVSKLADKSVNSTRITTTLKRYGVTNVSQIPEHREKMRMDSKIGRLSNFASEEFKSKMKTKYDKSNYAQTTGFKTKSKATFLKKYGFKLVRINGKEALNSHWHIINFNLNSKTTKIKI